MRFLRRLIAFAIDCTVLFAVFAAPQFLLATILGDWVLDQDSAPWKIWGWVALTVSLPSWIYFIWCDRSERGQTVGKRLTGLRVRREDGARLDTRTAIVRTAVKLIPWEFTHIMINFPEPFGDGDPSTGKMALMIIDNVLLILWLAVPMLDRPRHRGVHDRVAHTEVADASQGR